MILLITFLITAVALGYFSYKDLRYRVFESFIPLVLVDLVALFGSLYTYGVNLVSVGSCFCLALPFYLIELFYQYKKKKEKREDDSFIFGGADIVIAPAVTCWFGLAMPIFLIFYLITMFLTKSKKVQTWLDSFCVNRKMVKEGYYPKIPFLTVSCYLSATVVVALAIFI